MEGRANPTVRIDLSQFKLHVRLKPRTELTLHFDSPSRRFYLSVIALIVKEMKKLRQITSIPLGMHIDQLALLNETVGGSAGSSEKETLVPRIYRKWKDVLPDLENAPLFKVVGRKKAEEGGEKVYRFSEEEKDTWANLFEYKGSEEHVRLRFSIDKLGAGLDDVSITYEDCVDQDAWERFISTLQQQPTESPQPDSGDTIGEASLAHEPRAMKGNPLSLLRRRTAVVIAAMMVALGVFSFVIWQSRSSHRSDNLAAIEQMAFPLPDKPSIVVLPFVNMSGDPEQGYFCDGMTDQIITSLSMVPRLFVIARDSSFTYKGKAVKVQKVAEEMGVRYVLEGSIQRSGSRMRVMVQLIDAIKGVHLWSERYDREVRDIFAVQDDIARYVLTALQVKLTEGEHAAALARTTSNLRAIECAWRAHEYFYRLTKEDNVAARRWAEEAITLDPSFTSAWGLLGFIHFMDANFGWSRDPVESLRKAERCAQNVLMDDRVAAAGHALLCSIRGIQGRHDEALAHGEKAVALAPNNHIMMSVLAFEMHFAGRFDESTALLKSAMRVCPYYPAVYLRFLAPSYILTGRYHEAIEACKVIFQRSRLGEFNSIFGHIFLAEAYAALGETDNAKAEAKEVLKIKPNFAMETEKFLSQYKDPMHKERHFALLRTAGLR